MDPLRMYIFFLMQNVNEYLVIEFMAQFNHYLDLTFTCILVYKLHIWSNYGNLLQKLKNNNLFFINKLDMVNYISLLNFKLCVIITESTNGLMKVFKIKYFK